MIAEFLPSADWSDLIHHEGQGVFCIGWLIVMNCAEPPFTDPAFTSHRPEAGAVTAAAVSVCIPGIAHIDSPADPTAFRRVLSRKFSCAALLLSGYTLVIATHDARCVEAA